MNYSFYSLKINLKFSLLIVLNFLATASIAQVDPFAENPLVTDAFASTTLINTQTTFMPAKEGWEFNIRHRFGAVKADRTFIKNFLGTDLVANIRFSAIFPIGDKTFLGIARTKYGKSWELEFKRALITQTTDHRIPVTLGFYFNAVCNSDDFPVLSKYAFWSDGITPFQYSFKHRLTYSTQILISRKFGKAFSVELNPILVYRNLVLPGEDNHTLNLSSALSYRISDKVGLLAEYGYRFNNRPADGLYPVSLGIEFSTVGHSFQLIVSSVGDLADPAIYSNKTTDYKHKEFILGFNIKRTFWYKKQQVNATKTN